MEKLELLDQYMQPTGIGKERKLLHRDGDVHGVVRVHILRYHHGCAQMLVQKRGMLCEAFPGYYDVACAGHIKMGDDPEETAVRELKEELHLTVTREALFHVGELYADWSVGNYFDREYSHIYLLVEHEPEFILQKEEVESVVWWSVEDLLEKLDDSLTTFCIQKQEAEMVLAFFYNLR